MRAGLLVALLLLATGPVPQAQAATIPAGFTDALVASVGAPTALAFTPDGRLLVTRQGGEVRVYNAGSLTLARVALNLAPVVCNNEERGVLGVAVDPEFATNNYIYLYYSFKKGGVCPDGDILNPNNPVNRVSRFVLQADNRVLTSTETVLIDNIPSVDGDHNGGDLQFGKDGYLYVSVGDNDCNYTGSGLCGGSNEASRDEFILLGKILRITRDGSIPPGNPFVGADSDRCNLTGRTTPGRRCQETYAWGLRNPWRMAFDPNAAGTRFFINDVGQRGWEEINLGQAGADFGWNCREGAHANSTTGKCNPTPPNMVDPIHEYPRSSGCASITGGAFVPNGVWPAEFDNTYLFGDYVCGKIFRLVGTAAGGYTATEFVTGMGTNSAVAMVFGPFGQSQALYYTTFAGGGQVRRLAYSHAPVAALSATPTSGPAPLAVTFSAAGSYDPDGEPLTYTWNFGDGSAPHAGTSPTAARTYTAVGTYTATVVARDPGGLASLPAAVVIHVGNTAPVPVILEPAASVQPGVGQAITLRGQAADNEDGPLAPGSLSWEVRLHHVDASYPELGHWHPHFSAAGVAEAVFTVPPPEDLPAAALSYLEIQLTAVDSHGLTTVVTQAVQPRRVNVTVDTTPPGLQVNINGDDYATPFTFVGWAGWQLAIGAAGVWHDEAGEEWHFDDWSGGGAPDSIRLPESDVHYTFRYRPAEAGAGARLFLPFVRR